MAVCCSPIKSVGPENWKCEGAVHIAILLHRYAGGPGNLNPRSGQINSFLRCWKLKPGPCTC